jgi:lysophospholipase L1-like esterase
MDPNADIVVVFGGTNDFGHGDAPFGTDQDETADTFCGALHVLYRKLKNRYPKATIVVLTPLHRICEDNIYGDGSKKVPTRPLSSYVEQIRKTAALYSFPVLDLYQVAELDPNDEVIHRDLMPDGLHPNADGHAILAEKIADYLLKMQND